MLNLLDARQLAQQYVEGTQPEHPSYRMVLGACCELPDGWYFDFRIEHIDGLPFESWDEYFAGAPGCMVSKADCSLRDVPWAEFQDRNFAKRIQNSN